MSERDCWWTFTSTFPTTTTDLPDTVDPQLLSWETNPRNICEPGKPDSLRDLDVRDCDHGVEAGDGKQFRIVLAKDLTSLILDEERVGTERHDGDSGDSIEPPQREYTRLTIEAGKNKTEWHREMHQMDVAPSPPLAQLQISHPAGRTSLPMADSVRTAPSQPAPSKISTASSTIPNISLSFVTASDREKMEQLFIREVGSGGGALSGEQAMDVLRRSELSESILSRIWTLSDTTKSGQLFFPEFVLAMYLCNLRFTGRELPQTLPERIKHEVSAMVDIISSSVPDDGRGFGTPGRQTEAFPPTVQRPPPQPLKGELLQTLVTQSTSYSPSIARAADILYKSSEDIVTECGWRRDHLVYNDAREAPLTVVSLLGHGSLGVVEEVSASELHKTFVRKRVRIPYSNRAQILQIIKREAATMAKLVHPHIVKIIGSYEDGPPIRTHYSLLMYPVGDDDLKTFLEIHGEQQINQSNFPYHISIAERNKWLWTWCGCLASALVYMHRSGVRHQDIKPSNIIHRGRNIFFTDFSSSGEFQAGDTTSTDSVAYTSDMYSAPEYFQDGARHGLGTDIFSLGCVFLEILAVLCQTTVASFQDFVRLGSRLRYRDSLDRISEWFSRHEVHWEIYKRIECMLEQKRENRPSAPEVLRFMLELTYTKVETLCPCHMAEIIFS